MKIKVVAYNIACAQWCRVESLVTELKPLNADILLLSEVPRLNSGISDDEWIDELAEKLGFKHFFIGTISSANHQAPDWPALTGRHGGKYKAILSRTPLTNCCDIELNGDGWSPASAVRADTIIAGTTITFYALHIPGIHNWQKSTHRHLATEIVDYKLGKNAIVGGDFNEPGNSEVMIQLIENSHLVNTVTKHPIDHVLYDNQNSEYAIDHILYDDQHGVRALASGEHWGAQVGENSLSGYLSDHPYIWTDFMIT